MKPRTLLLASWFTPALSTPSNPPIRNIYTFPPNRFIENIAVRPNSNLLVTSMSVPDLFSINPKLAAPTATVIHTFPNATGLMGITEVAPDVYALVSGTWDLANTRAAPGSLAVWTVDLNTPAPAVRLVTGIANSTIFNGLVRHPTNPTVLLAADSALGAVWRVDLLTGAYGVAFASHLLAPGGTGRGSNLGINGLAAKGKYLYFTNSAQKLFGRVRVDYQGAPTGAVEVVSNSTGAAADVIYDDIALEERGGGAWIASHPSYAVRVGGDGTQRVVNDTEKLLNPTSAAFGRGSEKERETLYVTNGGEFVGTDLINEGIVAIDLGRGGW